MAKSQKRLLNRRPPEPEMNVTPLVDVVLVLLIIFMVVVPALQEGETVVLPAITLPDAKAKEANPIEATIALGGRAVLDDERMPIAKLWPRLEAAHKKEPERKLRLLTDQRVPYKTVRETFAKVQEMGFKGVSLKVETVKKDDQRS